MKRRKLKPITIISKDEAITCERPALELPASHPFILHRNKLEAKWSESNRDGVAYMNVLDHESAKSMVAENAPRILDFVKKSKSETTIAREIFTSPCNKFFRIFVGGFITPDHDDPDRLESGWFVCQSIGPIEMMDKYTKISESVMREMIG